MFVMRTLQKQAGISLIEAMVSLFIFSVGALGLAALQTTAMVSSGDTKQRSLVIWKAQELADRMRSTKSSDDPDGLLPQYLAAIGGDVNDVGVLNANQYSCPATPTRCADYTNSSGSQVDGTVCTTAQLVAFDIWEVMCEVSSGLSPTIASDESDSGVTGVSNLDVVMTQDGSDYLLYFQWLSRASDANLTLQKEGLETDERTATTNLCGDDVDLDTRLDAYCIRVR